MREQAPKDTKVRMVTGTFNRHYGDLPEGRVLMVSRAEAERWVFVGDAEYVTDEEAPVVANRRRVAESAE